MSPFYTRLQYVIALTFRGFKLIDLLAEGTILSFEVPKRAPPSTLLQCTPFLLRQGFSTDFLPLIVDSDLRQCRINDCLVHRRCMQLHFPSLNPSSLSPKTWAQRDSFRVNYSRHVELLQQLSSRPWSYCNDCAFCNSHHVMVVVLA